MKVYVLIDATAEDYCSDDRSVVGVFTKWETAFAKVKAIVPEAQPEPGSTWTVEDSGALWRRMEIEEHDLE